MAWFIPSLYVVVLPLLGAALVAALGIRFERIVPHVAVAIGWMNAAVALLMVPGITGQKTFAYGWLPGISEFSVVPDPLGGFIALAAAVLGALILTYSLRYMEHEEGKPRYYALVLMFIGAMSGLVLSGSLLSMYFFWEVCGICSFSLIGFHYDDPKALKGAIKAFITTRAGDVGLISGILTLYFSSSPHTFDLGAIVERAASGEIPAASLAFAAFAMLLGAMGKSAQVPLHIWLPDAMEAPTSVSALIHAATMVNAGVYLAARMYPAFKEVPGWTSAVTWVGAVTLLLAALMAVAAKDLKRMLAYSTVSQLGYMFFAVGNGAILASQFHLISHAVFKALLFLAAGALIHEAGTRDMNLLSGAGKKMPVTGTMFLLGVMGLTGIPLTSGFFSKDMIFSEVLKEGAYAPLAVAVVGAALTFTYSWRAYLKVFCGEPSSALHHAHEVHASMLWPMEVLGLGSLTSWFLIGLQSGKMHQYLESAGAHAISPLELVEETFTSPAFLLSAAAIALGLVLIARRDRVFAWLDSRASRFMAAAYEGFYFDRAYLVGLAGAGRAARAIVLGLDAGISAFLAASGRFVRAVERFTYWFDSRIIEGVGRLIGWLAKWGAAITVGFDYSGIEGLGRALIRLFRWGSKKALEFDYDVIEGTGRAMIDGVEQSSRSVKRSETGDLNANLVKILVGISIVLVIVLLETGVTL